MRLNFVRGGVLTGFIYLFVYVCIHVFIFMCLEQKNLHCFHQGVNMLHMTKL